MYIYIYTNTYNDTAAQGVLEKKNRGSTSTKFLTTSKQSVMSTVVYVHVAVFLLQHVQVVVCECRCQHMHLMHCNACDSCKLMNGLSHTYE